MLVYRVSWALTGAKPLVFHLKTGDEVKWFKETQVGKPSLSVEQVNVPDHSHEADEALRYHRYWLTVSTSAPQSSERRS